VTHGRQTHLQQFKLAGEKFLAEAFCLHFVFAKSQQLATYLMFGVRDNLAYIGSIRVGGVGQIEAYNPTQTGNADPFGNGGAGGLGGTPSASKISALNTKQEPKSLSE